MDIEKALLDMDELIGGAILSSVEVLEEASGHILSGGGKRVRPRLMLLVYEALGGTQINERTLRAAAAVEIVHTATLVHDDINDHSMLRRGKESVNSKWDRTFALLTGDYLFTKVYQLMAPLGDLNITLSEAVVALVEGETLQAHAAKYNDLSREVYQQIIAKKTASLFRAAAMLGAQLAEADDKQAEDMGEFGFYLGLLFQVVDDLLDLTGDPRLMGKPVGVDVSQGRGVGAVASKSTNGHAHVEVEDAAPDRDITTSDQILAIKQRLIDNGAVEEGRQMIGLLASQARAKLDLLPPGPAVDELNELVTFVAEREH